MTLITAPGFMLASSVEGVEFWEAAENTGFQLYNTFYFPGFLASALSVPVTAMATLLPGTSSLTPVMGHMIWEGIGIIFTFIFFMLIRPPFYKTDQ